MAHPFVETPRSEAVDRTRMLPDMESMLESFVAPANSDNLLNAVRGGQGRNTFATPRLPLANRKNAQTRQEFTPLLKSAAKNRFAMRGGLLDQENLATPAALKPGFQLSSPGVPDASSMDNSSMISDSDRTPMPEVNSSSFENSTPMAMPKGQLDSGNVLTLREQEAVRWDASLSKAIKY